MTLHTESNELLAALPRLLEGVSVQVLDEHDRPTSTFGVAGDQAERLRVEIERSALVASMPKGHPATSLVRALLQTVADRERLESDMESMNVSALRLLEQVSMMGETLPRLSAGGDDAEIATLGVRACQRAADVQHVIYLGHSAGKEACEVVVHLASAGADPRAVAEVDPVQSVEGLLAEILRADGVVLRSVPAGGRLGEPGSVEHLATRQLLGVPVTYGAGDKRVTLGALLLIDRAGGADGFAAAGGELGNEEGQVAESFAAMLGAVLGARKVAALGKELSMAQAIQQQILPDGPVVLPGFDVAAGYFACGAVGGDYFDYVPLADGRTMIVVADVSGHNLASGMVMVGARAMLRTLSLAHGEPHRVFNALAEQMHQDLTRTERFLTAAAVALRPGTRSIDYVSAGHNDLLIYRARQDRVEAHPSEGVILGFVPDPDYEVRAIGLEPGDCMLLYTDGIPEALDETGEMFGEDRLAAVFAQLAPNRSAQRILDGIVRELDEFRRGLAGTDDVTAVVIRCTEQGATR